MFTDEEDWAETFILQNLLRTQNNENKLDLTPEGRKIKDDKRKNYDQPNGHY